MLAAGSDAEHSRFADPLDPIRQTEEVIMKVHARFYVHSITKTNTDYVRVELNPVTRADGGNVDWSKFTPSGQIWMNVSKDSGAAAEFERALDEHRDVAVTFEVVE